MSVNAYLIDNEIIFIPSEKIIKSRTTNQTQTLHAPAVRCLVLLIESKTTVPQTGLYKAGWGEDALKKVSTATYYQCFVNLRKQLREIGYSGELLITVPKEGIKLNETIEIIPFTPAPLPEKWEANKVEQRSLAFNRIAVTRQRIAVLMLAAIAGLVLVFMFILPDGEQHLITLGDEPYQRYQELPECIFVRSVQSPGVDVERINQFILAKNVVCPPKGKTFIHQGKIRTTVFHCSDTMNCHSITYVNKPL